ncbi:MAG: membrane protein insertase YidC [Chlamydiae bacterium]|nr:membrane protein insertase YidC [Chlamydiota bacterium]
MDKRSLIFVAALTASLFFVNQWFSSKSSAKKAQQEQLSQTAPTTAASPPVNPASASNAQIGSEQFYVLENEYQQIVFSTYGGAIAEINLPMASDKNPQSIIRPINFDKIMLKDYPKNDKFPCYGYKTVENGSVMSKAEGAVGGYYPLLRRSIIDENGVTTFRTPARNYAFNTLSDDPSTANLNFSVTRFEKNTIEFQATDGGKKITKRYFLPTDATKQPFCFDLEINVEGDNRNLWITTGIPEVELISGNFSPSLKFLTQRNQKTVVENLSLPKGSPSINTDTPNWICNSNGFLGMLVTPTFDNNSGLASNQVNGTSCPSRITVIDAKNDLYPASKFPGYEIQLPLKASADTVKFRVFAGPFQDDVLQLLDETFKDPQTGKTPRYVSAISFQGWFTFISEPFAKFLFILMKLFHKITTSWGLSIILLTIVLRFMLYPLNSWSMKSSLKMQQIAPQVTAIQEKYKKDPKRAQMEVVALYREKGVNPLTGCFPILIQLPFLIGMFDLLKSVFELRGASFIPGWITNLTEPDVLFSWGYPLPFFGNSFHLLPFLLGAVMFFQQKLASPLPKDVKQLTDQQKQQKMMGNIMVVVFTVMFYNFPSGLNIYWLSSMSLGILQQWMTNKKFSNNKPNLIRVK